MSGDLNTNKNICQQFIKEPEPDELVYFCLHFGINLHHIHSGNTEIQFDLSKTIIVLIIVLKISVLKYYPIIKVIMINPASITK